MEKVCKLIYNEYPIQMNSLAISEYLLFTKDREDRTRISERCYVYTAGGTKSKCNILNYIFTQLDLNPSDLEFELIPKSDRVLENTDEISENSAEVPVEEN